MTVKVLDVFGVNGNVGFRNGLVMCHQFRRCIETFGLGVGCVRGQVRNSKAFGSFWQGGIQCRGFVNLADVGIQLLFVFLGTMDEEGLEWVLVGGVVFIKFDFLYLDFYIHFAASFCQYLFESFLVVGFVDKLVGEAGQPKGRHYVPVLN